MNTRFQTNPQRKLAHGLLLFACFATWVSAQGADAQWSRFRGPDGNGISSARNLPIRWTDNDFRWKIPLPGKGHSSPVVWKDRIYLTSGDGATADRFITCVQSADGKPVWEKKFTSQTFQKHPDNSYGTSTPAVDDSGVYVYWATPGEISVVALTLNGEEKWIKKLGPFKSQHGCGTSPVVVNQWVWINNDQDGPSALLALDVRSGEVKYKIDRTADKASYATPCLFKREGLPDELIFAASSHGLTSVNPLTGTVNWDCTNLFSSRVVASPMTSDGLVICTSGEGGAGRRLVAVRPATDKNPATVAWELKTGIPYVPTPVAKDGRLYLIGDNGLIRCVRAGTGEAIWQEKLQAQFYGSPILTDNRLYVISRTGIVFVMACGDKFELLAQNPLGEPSFATPAIAQDTLLFRTLTHLISVGGRK